MKKWFNIKKVHQSHTHLSIVDLKTLIMLLSSQVDHTFFRAKKLIWGVKVVSEKVRAVIENFKVSEFLKKY